LRKAIKKVLQEVEKNIFKTNPDIITGEVRDCLKIHSEKRKRAQLVEKFLSRQRPEKLVITNTRIVQIKISTTRSSNVTVNRGPWTFKEKRALKKKQVQNQDY
jgi:hypothetical protein